MSNCLYCFTDKMTEGDFCAIYDEKKLIQEMNLNYTGNV